MTEPFKVVCDETNNTPETLAQGKLIADLWLDPYLFNLVRQANPEAFAEEIVSVQPMDDSSLADIYEVLKSHPDHYLTFVARKTDE